MPIALLLAFALVACASTPGADRPRFDASARDAWHAARIKALAAENGWLTLVGLDFLKDGEATIGSTEIAQNIGQVAQAAQNTAEGASNAQLSSQELARMAQNLQRLVEEYQK